MLLWYWFDQLELDQLESVRSNTVLYCAATNWFQVPVGRKQNVHTNYNRNANPRLKENTDSFLVIKLGSSWV